MKYIRNFFDGYLVYSENDIKTSFPRNLFELIKYSFIGTLSVFFVLLLFGLTATLIGAISTVLGWIFNIMF